MDFSEIIEAAHRNGLQSVSNDQMDRFFWGEALPSERLVYDLNSGSVEGKLLLGASGNFTWEAEHLRSKTPDGREIHPPILSDEILASDFHRAFNIENTIGQKTCQVYGSINRMDDLLASLKTVHTMGAHLGAIQGRWGVSTGPFALGGGQYPAYGWSLQNVDRNRFQALESIGLSFNPDHDVFSLRLQMHVNYCDRPESYSLPKP